MELIYERMEKKYPPQQHFKDIVNIRISRRLAVLCVKGYYQDTHKTFSQRMAVWNSVGNDSWVKNRINLSLIDKYDGIVLFVAKNKLLHYLLDPVFILYGKMKS
mgnify:CR=1 FL=1